MKKTTKLLSLIIAICIGLTAFSGCELFLEKSISFSQTEIDMVYGESLDLAPYIKIKNLERGVYTLSVTHQGKIVDVVTQSGIKARAAGEAVVTATLTGGSSASIKVNVRHIPPTSLRLFESGELYQRTDSGTSVIFTAVFSEGTDPTTAINWYLDGEKQEASGNTFTLPAKSEAGAYTVRAEQTDNPALFDEKTVRVYSNYVLPVFTYGGEEVYDSPTSVSFGFDGHIVEGNPEYLYEMFINGQLHEARHGYSPTFTYTPVSAGIYTFSFKVNGETILRSGAGGSVIGSSAGNGAGNFFMSSSAMDSYSTTAAEDSVRICFQGVVTPHGLELDFASSYPSVILSWLNREQTVFTLSITPNGGSEQIISGIAAENGFVDIAEYIDLTKNYTLKIKSENHGEYFLGSDYVSFTHTAISAAAAHYLSLSYLDGHLYMTDDSKVFDVFDYMLVFRPNPTVSPDKTVSEISVFMGYTSDMPTAMFEKQFENRMTITGNYWWTVLGMAKKGCVLKLSVTFYSKNSPENFAVNGKTKFKTLIAPALSGGYGNQLPVDSFPLSKSVATNTNELFYTLERGLKPLLQEGSSAERIYNKARDVLSGILSKGMSEAEIAGAIYDWIIFAQSYDNDVTSAGKGIDYAVIQPAYYPEGVFETGFAVCDGISKSYSLLCNMMGIKCLRVVGKAGINKIDHAWNKVLIGGQWYIVDATWGGGSKELDFSTYKMGTREYFLLSDADTASSHIELGFLFPKTAPTGYDWHIKNNRYLFATQDLATQVKALVDRIEEFYARGRQYTVLGQAYSADFCAFEIKISSGLSREFNGTPNILTKQLDLRGFGELGYEYINVTGTTTIIIALRWANPEG